MSAYADLACKVCKGVGRTLHFPPDAPPYAVECECTKARRRLADLDMGWAGVSLVPTLKGSPLAKLLDSNVWITAGDSLLRSHLKTTFLPTKRSFRVVTDSDLMGAWLATAASEEIFDLDARGESSKAASLPDLVMPPDVLIIRLGVKSARNSAMGEVLAEALLLRLHRLRTVWVVDSKVQPYSPGHLAFSSTVSELLGSFERADLEKPARSEDPPIRTLAPSKPPRAPAPAEDPEEPAGLSGGGKGTPSMLMKMVEDDGKLTRARKRGIR